MTDGQRIRGNHEGGGYRDTQMMIYTEEEYIKHLAEKGNEGPGNEQRQAEAKEQDTAPKENTERANEGGQEKKKKKKKKPKRANAQAK